MKLSSKFALVAAATLLPVISCIMAFNSIRAQPYKTLADLQQDDAIAIETKCNAVPVTIGDFESTTTKEADGSFIYDQEQLTTILKKKKYVCVTDGKIEWIETAKNEKDSAQNAARNDALCSIALCFGLAGGASFFRRIEEGFANSPDRKHDFPA